MSAWLQLLVSLCNFKVGIDSIILQMWTVVNISRPNREEIKQESIELLRCIDICVRVLRTILGICRCVEVRTVFYRHVIEMFGMMIEVEDVDVKKTEVREAGTFVLADGNMC